MNDKAERQERARRAVSVFRAMQPGLTGFARALSGRRDVVVQLAEQGGSTDGKNIFFKPPIALGDMTPHSRGLCDKRDAETLVQLCAACKVREEVLIVIYHEIAHIAFGTFRQPTNAEKNQAVEAAITEVGTKYAQRIRQKVDAMPAYLKADHLTMSQIVSPFLPTLINAIEDARIDEKLFQARRGTRAMFDALNQVVFNEGYEEADGTRSMWTERPLNSQVIIGVFVLGCGYDYAGWFSPQVEKALDDEKLRELTDEIADLRSVHDTYKLSFKVLARLRELGFCLNPNEPQDEEEQEEDEDQVPDEGGASEEDPSSEEASQDGSPGDEGDPGQEGSDSDGSGEAEGSDASGREDSEDDSDAGDPSGSDGDGDTEQSPGSGDPSGSEPGDGGSEEDGSESSEASGADEEGDESPAESGGSESSGSQGGSPGGSERSGDEDEGEDLSDGEEGSSDREDEGSEDDSSGGDSGDGDGESDSGADDSEPDSGDPGDDLDAEVDPVDSGADEGKGGDQSTIDPSDPNYGTAEQVADDLQAFSKHDLKSKPVPQAAPTQDDDAAITVAIIQGQYFETSSVDCNGVREFKYGDVLPNGHKPDGWADLHSRYARLTGAETDMTISETVLGPALLEMRRVLSDNERAAMERHLRSGKINQRVLGKRAWAGDDRLFQKKRLPGKKSYAVVLGIDISASTVGINIALAKRAAMAQAELLSRMGIDFAIYAHSANSTDGYRTLWLDMYEIKAFDSPWGPTEHEALEKISPDSENLDGHSIEYYRKLVERQSATDKIILYYSDGKMPAANHDEELEILEREIAYCKKNQITLMGVGIRTDSPRRHGLDTVQVDNDSDIVKVVRHLKNGLLHNR